MLYTQYYEQKLHIRIKSLYNFIIPLMYTDRSQKPKTVLPIQITTV